MAKKKATDVLKRLKEIDKSHGDVMLMSGKVKPVPTTPSGIYSLNLALSGLINGGYAQGRIIEIYGAESTGKTTLTLQAIAAAQAQGGVCAFIDAEHAVDLSYAAGLGVDVGSLLFSQPDCGEMALQAAIDLATAMSKGDIIVIDSVAALTPKAELEGELDDSNIGMQALMMSRALKLLASAVGKSGVILVFVNQIRSKVMVMFGSNKNTTGGNALKFYTTQRVEIARTGQVKVTEKKVEKVVGHKLKVKVVKNKVFPPFKEFSTEVRYGRGIPKALDLILLGMDKGITSKQANAIVWRNSRIAPGLHQAYLWFEENQDSLDMLEKEVIEAYEHTS